MRTSFLAVLVSLVVGLVSQVSANSRPVITNDTSFVLPVSLLTDSAPNGNVQFKKTVKNKDFLINSFELKATDDDGDNITYEMINTIRSLNLAEVRKVVNNSFVFSDTSFLAVVRSVKQIDMLIDTSLDTDYVPFSMSKILSFFEKQYFNRGIYIVYLRAFDGKEFSEIYPLKLYINNTAFIRYGMNNKTNILNDTQVFPIDSIKNLTLQVVSFFTKVTYPKDDDGRILGSISRDIHDGTMSATQLECPSGKTFNVTTTNIDSIIKSNPTIETGLANNPPETGIYKITLFATNKIDTAWYTLKVAVTETDIYNLTPTIRSIKVINENSITFGKNTIKYSVAKQSIIKCNVYALSGALVRSFSTIQSKGDYSYKPDLSAGSYVSRFTIDNVTKVHNFNVIK